MVADRIYICNSRVLLSISIDQQLITIDFIELSRTQTHENKTFKRETDRHINKVFHHPDRIYRKEGPVSMHDMRDGWHRMEVERNEDD